MYSVIQFNIVDCFISIRHDMLGQLSSMARWYSLPLTRSLWILIMSTIKESSVTEFYSRFLSMDLCIQYILTGPHSCVCLWSTHRITIYNIYYNYKGINMRILTLNTDTGLLDE